MPIAKSFKALGAGNGFPFCLAKFSGTANNEYFKVGAAPTLEETMNAYWNFDSASWDEAEFDPTNEPKDLVGTPTANVGGDTDYTAGEGPRSVQYYRVQNSKPRIYVEPDGTEHYCHGISISYEKHVDFSTEYPIGGEDFIYVNYASTVHSASGIPYGCGDETASWGTNFGPSGSQSSVFSYTIGKSSSETELVSANAVTIQGLPFVKTVVKGFHAVHYDYQGADGVCITAGQQSLAEPTEQPELKFHTY
mgnify:CR=1 FL=1